MILQLRSLVPYAYGISEIVVWNVPSTSGNAHYGVASTDAIIPHENNMAYDPGGNITANWPFLPFLPFVVYFTDFDLLNQQSTCQAR